MKDLQALVYVDETVGYPYEGPFMLPSANLGRNTYKGQCQDITPNIRPMAAFKYKLIKESIERVLYPY